MKNLLSRIYPLSPLKELIQVFFRENFLRDQVPFDVETQTQIAEWKRIDRFNRWATIRRFVFFFHLNFEPFDFRFRISKRKSIDLLDKFQSDERTDVWKIEKKATRTTIKTIVAHTYNTIKNRLRPIFSSNGERFTNHIADTTYSSQPFHKFKLFELMLTVFSRLTAILSHGIRVANFSLDQVQLKKYIHLSALPSGHWDERDFVSWLQFLKIIAIESAWPEFRKTPYIQRVTQARAICPWMYTRVYAYVCAECGTVARRVLHAWWGTNGIINVRSLLRVTRLRERKRVMTLRGGIYRARQAREWKGRLVSAAREIYAVPVMGFDGVDVDFQRGIASGNAASPVLPCLLFHCPRISRLLPSSFSSDFSIMAIFVSFGIVHSSISP